MEFAWFKAVVGKGIEAIKLDRAAMRDLSEEGRVFAHALVIVALGGVAAALGQFRLAGLIFYPILSLFMFFLNVAVLHLMAGVVFKGTGRFNQLLQVLGAASVINWISVVPVLGGLLGLLASFWFLAVEVVALEELYDLDRGKAVLSVVIPFAVFFVLMMLTTMMVGGMWIGGPYR